MRTRKQTDRSCAYVVVLGGEARSADALRDLASYLSNLGLAGAEVIIVDPSPRSQFERNTRVLRWVGRHVAPLPVHYAASGRIDALRAGADFASCDKIIVASEDVRYSTEAIARVCGLLERHEAVEPQEFVEMRSWWSAIDAGKILVHRGVEAASDPGSTVGVRRSVVRVLRGIASLDVTCGDARRLTACGAEVHPAAEVFVRRDAAELRSWIAARPRLASDDFALPVKTAFFLSLVPLLIALAFLGGVDLAGTYAGVIACGSIGLAVRGRSGASDFFPLYACFFAPLWVAERSVSVYWGLLRKFYAADRRGDGVAVPDNGRGEKVASGE